VIVEVYKILKRLPGGATA